MIALQKRQFIILFGIMFVIALFLLSSCSSPTPEPYTEYSAPEPDLPQTPQGPLPASPPDTNDISTSEGPLKIGIREAILLAMENNQSLIVERLNPRITAKPAKT